MSDSPTLTTGYSTISKEICNRLAAKGWEIHYFGNNYIGQNLVPGTKFEDGTTLNFTVWGNGRENYHKDVLVPRLREIRPQVFVTLLDTFMLYPWYAETDFSPAKSVFYYPSDGGEQLPQGCELVLQKMSLSVAMSKFAQTQAKEKHGLDSLYIPHAVDHELYKPLSPEDKVKCRARWGLNGKFVVGIVARNQGRKMLDRGVKAFVDFCKDKPDAILFMHTDPTDQAAVFDINALIARYKLWNRVVFSGTRYFKGLNYNEMVQVYNAMDVFFLPTSGEGWGVPTTEAMSCEIPCVVTDYTTTKEMVVDHQAGLGVKLAAEITGSWNVERGVMDVDDAVKCLNTLYSSPKVREEMGKNGRKAVLEEYNWEKVAEDWNQLLTGLIEW